MSCESCAMEKRYEQDETLRSMVRHMSIHPNSSVPLLPSDQADVIRIFLELMREGNCPASMSEGPITKKPLGPTNNSKDRWFPSK